MAINLTDNYGLKKPEKNEFFDVQHQNDNIDIIDTAMKDNANDIFQLSQVATQMTNGLMSAEDKSKLDRVEDRANNYDHPTSSGNRHIPAGGAAGQVLKWNADGTAIWGADDVGLPLTGGTLTGVLNVGYILKVLGSLEDESTDYSLLKKAHYDKEYGTDILDSASDGKLRWLRIAGPHYVNPMYWLMHLRADTDGNNSVAYGVYHEGNITVSTSTPSSALAEGCQHQVY